MVAIFAHMSGQRNGDIKMSDNKKERKSYYSALTGFKRAVPVILAAIAVFIGICFCTDGTGVLGGSVGALLLGLFSYGAYAIPLLLVIHAVFYAEDVAKNRILSRIIFSVVAVIFISTIEYTITYWSEEFIFDPPEMFVTRSGGGFIGSAIAFLLVKVFGRVGIFILAAAILGIYIAFFFMGEKSAFRDVMLTIIGGIASALAFIERQIKKLFSSAKRARADKRIKENEKKNAELLDDQFFEVDDGMSELKIQKLGIHTAKSSGRAEEELTLQSSVFHKSRTDEISEDIDIEPKDDIKEEPKVQTASQRSPREISFDYGLSYSNEPTVTAPEKEPVRESSLKLGLDESAEKVFTKEFNPFDFTEAEKQASRPSSRAVAEKLPNLNAAEERDSLERAKQRAEFEAMKARVIEEKRRSVTTPSFVTRSMSDSDNCGIPSRTVTEASTAETAPKIEISDVTPNEPIKKEVSSYDVFKTTSNRPLFDKERYNEYKEDEQADAAIRISEAIASSNPTYTRSFNSSYTNMTVSDDKKEETKPVIEEINEYSTPLPSSEGPTPQFKQFTPEQEYEPQKASEGDEELIIERTPLSEEDSMEKVINERDSKYTVISSDMQVSQEENESAEETTGHSAENDGYTFLDFDEEDEDGEEELSASASDYDEIFGGIEEEEAVSNDEIPPEEQNPNIGELRKMFPFLDADDKDESEPDEPVTNEQDEPDKEDDGEPPFDVPKSERPSAPAEPKENMTLVPTSSKQSSSSSKSKVDYSNYEFPPIELLGVDKAVVDENIGQEMQENADKLIETLASFNVTASIKGVDRGPRITRYEVVPAKGIKVSSVMNLQDNIALDLAAEGIRMEAPIPGKSAIGVEIPNKTAVNVRLRELLETDEFKFSKSKTTVCIGKDVSGQPVFGDIAKMPHLLIAGATGMGKSVCINSLMVSMLYKARPDEVRFIMIDPKQVEFTMYNSIPHLLVPVVTDPKKAAGSLAWAAEEMERRYNRLSELCVRNADAYNEKVSKNPSLGEPMAKIVIVIDEFADLMMQVKDPVEQLVMRIAQKARAAGIHLIIGTQRPAVNVITGTIKANIPSRISCKVASNVDSRTVLDASGAEKLLNRGDMLYAFAGAIKPLRVQGAFLSDSEVEDVMNFLKERADGANYDDSVMEEIERAAQKCSKKGGDHDDSDGDESVGEGYLNDRQFLEAVELAVNMRKISTSLIQRKISIGYDKAAKFIDTMEDMGIVGEPNGQKPREVLITADEWREKLARISLD